MENNFLEYLEKIPNLAEEYMKKGRNILPVNKWMEWDKQVIIQLYEKSKGQRLDECLILVEALNQDDSMNEAKHLYYQQEHDGYSGLIVMDLVKRFSKKGFQFEKYMK